MEIFDVFKFSRVKFPDRTDNEYFANGRCPLEDEAIEVLYGNLEWEEIVWGNTSMLLKGERRI
jgi:hypothetical protein